MMDESEDEWDPDLLHRQETQRPVVSERHVEVRHVEVRHAEGSHVAVDENNLTMNLTSSSERRPCGMHVTPLPRFKCFFPLNTLSSIEISNPSLSDSIISSLSICCLPLYIY